MLRHQAIPTTYGNSGSNSSASSDGSPSSTRGRKNLSNVLDGRSLHSGNISFLSLPSQSESMCSSSFSASSSSSSSSTSSDDGSNEGDSGFVYGLRGVDGLDARGKAFSDGWKRARTTVALALLGVTAFSVASIGYSLQETVGTSPMASQQGIVGSGPAAGDRSYYGTLLRQRDAKLTSDSHNVAKRPYNMERSAEQIDGDVSKGKFWSSTKTGNDNGNRNSRSKLRQKFEQIRRMFDIGGIFRSDGEIESLEEKLHASRTKNAQRKYDPWGGEEYDGTSGRNNREKRGSNFDRLSEKFEQLSEKEQEMLIELLEKQLEYQKHYRLDQEEIIDHRFDRKEAIDRNGRTNKIQDNVMNDGEAVHLSEHEKLYKQTTADTEDELIYQENAASEEGDTSDNDGVQPEYEQPSAASANLEPMAQASDVDVHADQTVDSATQVEESLEITESQGSVTGEVETIDNDSETEFGKESRDRGFANFKDSWDGREKAVDVPVFWTVGNAGGDVVLEIVGGCHEMTLAESGVNADEMELGVVLKGNDQPGAEGRRYVNVDLSTVTGIKRAKELGLVSSQLTDVIVSPLLFEASSLFDNTERAGRIFTIIKHPVDWVIASFYASTLHQVMTLEEYASQENAGNLQNNLLTRYLSGNLNDDFRHGDLDAAMELMRTKILVGLESDLRGSMNRFEKYFEWKYRTNPTNQEVCRESQLNLHEQSWKTAYEAEVRSKVYESLAARNSYDMQLYAYAETLYKEQESFVMHQVDSYRNVDATCCQCDDPPSC